MARKVIRAAGGKVRGKTIAIFGLTFKPDTDDMRESPALTIVQALVDKGAQIRAYDPEGMEQAKPLLPPQVTFCSSAYEAAEGANASVIVTEWNAFRSLDLKRLKKAMAEAVLVDLRNIYRPEEVRRAGFAYSCIGRGDAAVLEAPEVQRAAE
jgi:UDPglucose 6-dehydrogenase